ncbi:MAG: sulfatase-like hydrolase/transferase [Candidatus Schekmanbacteria bacterium]|nr:sulfatase-like hydrolase/transferase [Candidatus Schekmanbacteria bacterium]
MGRRASFVIALFCFNFAIFAAFRVAFLTCFKPDALPLSSGPLVYAYYLGMKFDARLAALICLPILLLSAVPHLDFTKSRFGRFFWTSALAVGMGAIMLLYAIDFGAFGYLQTRLNTSLATLLDDPDIALGMVWQTYPVVPGLSGIVAATLLYGLAVRRLGGQRMVPGAAEPPRSRRRAAIVHACCALVLIGLAYGKLARYPLRWSEAFFSKDTFVSQFALNPVLFLFDTMEEEPLSFDEASARRHYDAVASYLEAPERHPETLSLARRGRPTPLVAGRPNVVLVMLETFAAYKTGTFGSGLDSSPSFDRLAAAGMLFTRFYTPMENTSRSLFAALFGIPDVSVKQATSRNPLAVDQHTICNAFVGYDRLYFLGGSANWGNIRGMLSHNIDGLQIFEEGSYDSPVNDVWGISDADLFEEANMVFRRRPAGRPFFAIVQTAGNHRPYDIPRDAKGFVPVQIGEDEVRAHGFHSVEEYNSFRFLDHSLGHFMKVASREAYFDDTLFVIYGDHGTTGGATDRRYGELALASFHVPLLLYAPKLLGAPRRIGEVASELDIMPTLAGMLGLEYVNTAFGRNLLEPRRDAGGAFTYSAFRYPPQLGFIEGDYYVNVEPDGGARLFRLDTPGEEDISGAEPHTTARLAERARGIYELARYLIYHNKPVGTAAPVPSAAATREATTK